MPRNGRLPALVLLLGVGLVPVSAQAIEGRVVVLGEEGDSSPGISALATAASIYDLPPSVTTTSRSPYGTGEQEHKERLGCVLLPYYYIVPNCTITMNWRAASGSGGHEHGGDRPAGRIETGNGESAGAVEPGPGNDPTPRLVDSSGGDGILGITYFAPEASGRTRVTFRGYAFVFGEPVYFYPTGFDIRVGLDGLVQLPSGSDRFHPGVWYAKGHNHSDGYVRPEVEEGLKYAWDGFAEAVDSPPRLVISAASLPDGGLFETSGTEGWWKPPHVGHRFGLDVDIDNTLMDMSNDQKRVLADELEKRSFVFPVESEAPRAESPSHWHARFSD